MELPGADGSTSSVLIRAAAGQGLLLDQGGPFHDAHVRPALPDEVSAWLEGTRRRDRASLVIGELMLAPGVPAALDSGGFNRHTFMCGQSGSGKTYSLGLLLERVLAETTLRVVILDPNSDYVGLGRVRDGADPTLAERHRAVADDVAVWSNEPGADHLLKLRFAELDTRTQGAVLGIDPIADRGEYAVLSDLLRANASGQPLVTSLDQLVGSSNPSAQQLGMRAVNLGVLDWSVWGPEDRSLLQELKEPTSRCLVVDLGSLETLEEQRMIADAVLGSLWTTRRNRQPVLVVIDEAHNICAAEPDNAVSRITTERAIQIAAEGRKYGLYLLVSTQRPNKVHENVVSQCDNLLLMRMNSMADVADLTRLFSFVPPGLMAGAPSFGLGPGAGGRPAVPAGWRLRADGRPGVTGGWRRHPDHLGPGADVVVDNLLVVAGVALVITDYVIKFLAIGVLPNNRKPSSAMAWLILILIVPFAGFVIFLFLGRTNLGKGRLRRQREADEAIRAATDLLPVEPVAGPAYLASMAALNLNLGSLPLQTGNRVDLITGYREAIIAMTAEVETATESRRGGVLHRRLGRRDRAVLRGAGGRRRSRREGAAAVRPHGLAQHPGVRRVREAARRLGHRLATDAPDPAPQGPVPAPRPAQPPQAAGRRRAGRLHGLPEPHRAGLQQGEQPQGRPGVRRARRSHRRADGHGAAGGLREGLVHRDARAHGGGDRPGRRRLTTTTVWPRRCCRAGRATSRRTTCGCSPR